MKFVAKVDTIKWMTNDQLFCRRPQAKICYDTICNESCKFCENFSPPQINFYCTYKNNNENALILAVTNSAGTIC